MQNFTYQAAPMRVIFGRGTLGQLPAELERLGISRALILATPNQTKQAAQVVSILRHRAAGIFAEAAMHTPVDVTKHALLRVRELDANGVVAIGGGSTTGLGKAIAWRTGLPQVVVPTSYAGSEMTPILGETQDGLKTTQSSPKVLPETVIYDVDLTLTMPRSLSAPSARAPRPSTAPGCAEPASARSAWRCTTSSATRSAAPSICRTPKRTRPCF